MYEIEDEHVIHDDDNRETKLKKKMLMKWHKELPFRNLTTYEYAPPEEDQLY